MRLVASPSTPTPRPSLNTRGQRKTGSQAWSAAFIQNGNAEPTETQRREGLASIFADI